MPRVRITPPQQNTQRVRVSPPQMAYGGNKPGTYNQFDAHSWGANPNSEIGVNADPNPYSRTGRTLPEAPSEIANVNAEKNEKVLGNFTSDGQPSLMNVDGPPHTQGGKDVYVPPGAFIFSDTKSLKIKNPEILKMFNVSKPSTPAKIASKFDLSKYTKVVADLETDNVSKKTAQMMIDNNTNMLEKLANVQESMKQHKGLGNDNPQLTPMGEQSPMMQPQSQMSGGETRYMHGGMPQYQTGGYGDDVFDTRSYGVGKQSSNKPIVYPYLDQPNFPDDKPTQLPAYTVHGKRINQQEDSGPDWYWDPINGPYKDNYLSPSNIIPLTQSPVQPTVSQTPPPYTGSNFGSIPDNGNGASGNKSTNQTKVPFATPAPNRWGIENSLFNLASIHKYPAWEAPISATIPDTTFLDPTRALAATQEAANTAGRNSAMSSNGRANRATQLALQGEAGTQAADIVGRYNNENVNIANRASEQATLITNKLQEEQANRLNRIYQGNVIADQQYDNALREGRNDLTRQNQEAWKQRSQTSFLNATSPYFYEDPNTGARGFKSPEAEARYNNEILRMSQGTGLSSDALSKYKQAYDAAIAKGITLKRADEYGAEVAGFTDRDREKLNQVGIMQNETVSRSAVEGKEFGGSIPKRKFGGMSENKLKKFINGGKVLK